MGDDRRSGRDGVRLFTIGFTQKTAEAFFTALIEAGVRRVIDIRLNNLSQLAGFTKRDDPRYFLRAIGGIDYLHRPDLAPTQEIMEGFRKGRGGWQTWEKEFLALLAARRVEKAVTPELLHEACLLCSEAEPDRCHRRLVAEYLQSRWENLSVLHL